MKARPWLTTLYNSVTNSYATGTIMVPQRSVLRQCCINYGMSVPAVAAADNFVQVMVARTSDYSGVSGGGPSNQTSAIIAAIFAVCKTNATNGQSWNNSQVTNPLAVFEPGPMYVHYSASANATLWFYVTLTWDAV